MPVVQQVEICTIDLIHKLKAVLRQENRHLTVKGIVKEQVHLPRVFVIRLPDLPDHDPQHFIRKRIEKIETILILNLILPGVRTDKADALFVGRRNLSLCQISDRSFIQLPVKFNPRRAASGPVTQKEHRSPQPAPIIQHMAVSSDIPAFCQNLQDPIVCGLIRIAGLCDEMVNFSTRPDIQFLLPPML